MSDLLINVISLLQYEAVVDMQIKLKVDKSKSDKEEDQKRQKLLDFLNSSYE